MLLKLRREAFFIILMSKFLFRHRHKRRKNHDFVKGKKEWNVMDERASYHCYAGLLIESKWLAILEERTHTKLKDKKKIFLLRKHRKEDFCDEKISFHFCVRKQKRKISFQEQTSSTTLSTVGHLYGTAFLLLIKLNITMRWLEVAFSNSRKTAHAWTYKYSILICL